MGRLLLPLLVFTSLIIDLALCNVLVEERTKRGASNTHFNNWPLTIPYTISSSFSTTAKKEIQRALQTFADKTCIKFEEDSSSNPKLEYALIGNTSVCGSMVGDRRGARGANHVISLTLLCATDLGSTQHETTHALGFEHTQSRSDRDNYVRVENYNPNRAQNFIKLDPEHSPTYGIPFEYGSRMTTNPYYFPKDKFFMGSVITPHDEGYLTSIAASKTLTFYDWKMINIRYNCNACKDKIVCQNGGYAHPKDCAKCICGDFYEGNNCQTERGLITLKPEDAPLVLTIDAKNAVPDTKLGKSDWANFNVEPLRVIRASANRRIRVTVEKQSWSMELEGHLEGRTCERGTQTTCDLFAIEIADEDLNLTGKKFCCYDKVHSFVSKSDLIGYRAYSHRGTQFQSTVSFSVEPETDSPGTTTTTPIVPTTTTVSTATTTTSSAPIATTPPPPPPTTTTTTTTTTTAPATIPLPAPRPVPGKPDFTSGCALFVVYAFDEKAGRCLARATEVCNEQQWTAVKDQTYKACAQTAPFITPDTDREECLLGKAYERVPGEAEDRLYGKNCKTNFCRTEASCVQGDNKKAHCCVLPRWA